MNIKEICAEILTIEEGLDCGTISFAYDNLSSAMKCCHPVEILDDTISGVFWDLQEGRNPEREKIEDLLKGLKRFKRAFKVKELSKPIKDLTQYLSETESN